MKTQLSSLLLYRQSADSIVSRIAESEPDCLAAPLSALLEKACAEGWQGNLWHCLLTVSLLESENAFAMACERKPVKMDSLRQLALRDMQIFFDLFRMEKDCPEWPLITDFHHESDKAAPETLLRLVSDLASAACTEEMLCHLTDFYTCHGLGLLGLGQVFRLDEDGRLYAVANRRSVRLTDIVGYKEQKAALVENTGAFVRGRRANNVLLYGDAGTGKSTSVQAIAEEYAPQGLRLIELYKHQFALIPQLFRAIKNRSYRFIILLDDLSFEENEVEYKYLKAVLEGGAEAAPENIRIYATSNRRHLIKETWNDRSDMEHNGDVHRSDTMEEKLSLSARFGLQLFYPNPTFDEYQNIVASIAEREGVAGDLTAQQLKAQASTWEVRHGSRSGRSARQFVDSLTCRE